MKTIVISDLHLGKEFNEKKYKVLKKILLDSNQVVLNGDFWDDTKCTFDEFVDSKWSKLFPLLKKRNTVYIHGNHDLAHKSDERIFLFAKKVAKWHRIKRKGKLDLVVEHGHESSLLTRVVYFFFKNLPKTLHYITYPVGLLQWWQMSMSKKDVSVEKIANYSYRKDQSDKDYVLVTGHTHAPEFSPDEKYINTGFIDDDFVSYLVVEDVNIKLVRRAY